MNLDIRAGIKQRGHNLSVTTSLLQRLHGIKNKQRLYITRCCCHVAEAGRICKQETIVSIRLHRQI